MGPLRGVQSNNLNCDWVWCFVLVCIFVWTRYSGWSGCSSYPVVFIAKISDTPMNWYLVFQCLWPHDSPCLHHLVPPRSLTTIEFFTHGPKFCPQMGSATYKAGHWILDALRFVLCSPASIMSRCVRLLWWVVNCLRVLCFQMWPGIKIQAVHHTPGPHIYAQDISIIQTPSIRPTPMIQRNLVVL